jgi:hypothetical protein
MSKTIDDCLLLSHEDKQIFKHALSISDVDYLQNMSIFSKEGIYEKHGNYYVFKTNPFINIYYLGYNNNSIFIDENKKILFYSRYFLSYSFQEFINYINHTLYLIQNINIDENILDIGSNFVSIEKWFVTYGHFKDEIFVITDYIDNNNKNYKALLDYHTTDLPNYKANINYKIIDNILLRNNSINSYEHINKILRLKDLILIRHRITDTTFHSFPINVRNKIITSINTDNTINHNKIFITRGSATHLSRNLSNQMEVENYLHNNNFALVNPELLNYGEFINTIKNTDKIVITWGGALVNLIYLKPYTKVYILKSQSYEHESLDLFEKIIKTYDLHVEVIIHENNIISLNKLNIML